MFDGSGTSWEGWGLAARRGHPAAPWFSWSFSGTVPETWRASRNIHSLQMSHGLSGSARRESGTCSLSSATQLDWQPGALWIGQSFSLATPAHCRSCTQVLHHCILWASPLTEPPVLAHPVMFWHLLGYTSRSHTPSLQGLTQPETISRNNAKQRCHFQPLHGHFVEGQAKAVEHVFLLFWFKAKSGSISKTTYCNWFNRFFF